MEKPTFIAGSLRAAPFLCFSATPVAAKGIGETDTEEQPWALYAG